MPLVVHDTPAVRLQLRDLFRGAQWLCRFTNSGVGVPSSAAVLAGQRSWRCRQVRRAAAESPALPVGHWLSRGTFEHAAGRCPVGVDLCW